MRNRGVSGYPRYDEFPIGFIVFLYRSSVSWGRVVGVSMDLRVKGVSVDQNDTRFSLWIQMIQGIYVNRHVIGLGVFLWIHG